MENEMKPIGKRNLKHSIDVINISKHKRRSSRIQDILNTELASSEQKLPYISDPKDKDKNEQALIDESEDQEQGILTTHVPNIKDKEESTELICRDVFDIKSSEKTPKKEKKNYKKNNHCNNSSQNDTVQNEEVSQVYKIITSTSMKCSIRSVMKSPLKTYSNPKKSIEKNEVIESFGLPDKPLTCLPANMVHQLDQPLDTEVLDAKEITLQDLLFFEEPWCIIDLEDSLKEIRIKSAPQKHNNVSYPSDSLIDTVNTDFGITAPQRKKDKSQPKKVDMIINDMEEDKKMFPNKSTLKSKAEKVITNHSLTLEEQEIEIFNSNCVQNLTTSTPFKATKPFHIAHNKSFSEKKPNLVENNTESDYNERRKLRSYVGKEIEQTQEEKAETNNKRNCTSLDDIVLVNDITPKRILRSNSCTDLRFFEDKPVQSCKKLKLNKTINNLTTNSVTKSNVKKDVNQLKGKNKLMVENEKVAEDDLKQLTVTLSPLNLISGFLSCQVTPLKNVNKTNNISKENNLQISFEEGVSHQAFSENQKCRVSSSSEEESISKMRLDSNKEVNNAKNAFIVMEKPLEIKSTFQKDNIHSNENNDSNKDTLSAKVELTKVSDVAESNVKNLNTGNNAKTQNVSAKKTRKKESMVDTELLQLKTLISQINANEGRKCKILTNLRLSECLCSKYTRKSQNVSNTPKDKSTPKKILMNTLSLDKNEEQTNSKVQVTSSEIIKTDIDEIKVLESNKIVPDKVIRCEENINENQRNNLSKQTIKNNEPTTENFNDHFEIKIDKTSKEKIVSVDDEVSAINESVCELFPIMRRRQNNIQSEKINGLNILSTFDPNVHSKRTRSKTCVQEKNYSQQNLEQASLSKIEKKVIETDIILDNIPQKGSKNITLVRLDAHESYELSEQSVDIKLRDRKKKTLISIDLTDSDFSRKITKRKASIEKKVNEYSPKSYSDEHIFPKRTRSKTSLKRNNETEVNLEKTTLSEPLEQYSDVDLSPKRNRSKTSLGDRIKKTDLFSEWSDCDYSPKITRSKTSLGKKIKSPNSYFDEQIFSKRTRSKTSLGLEIQSNLNIISPKHSKIKTNLINKTNGDKIIDEINVYENLGEDISLRTRSKTRKSNQNESPRTIYESIKSDTTLFPKTNETKDIPKNITEKIETDEDFCRITRSKSMSGVVEINSERNDKITFTTNRRKSPNKDKLALNNTNFKERLNGNCLKLNLDNSLSLKVNLDNCNNLESNDLAVKIKTKSMSTVSPKKGDKKNKIKKSSENLNINLETRLDNKIALIENRILNNIEKGFDEKLTSLDVPDLQHTLSTKTNCNSHLNENLEDTNNQENNAEVNSDVVNKMNLIETVKVKNNINKSDFENNINENSLNKKLEDNLKLVPIFQRRINGVTSLYKQHSKNVEGSINSNFEDNVGTNLLEKESCSNSEDLNVSIKTVSPKRVGERNSISKEAVNIDENMRSASTEDFVVSQKRVDGDSNLNKTYIDSEQPSHIDNIENSLNSNLKHKFVSDFSKKVDNDLEMQCNLGKAVEDVNWNQKLEDSVNKKLDHSQPFAEIVDLNKTAEIGVNISEDIVQNNTTCDESKLKEKLDINGGSEGSLINDNYSEDTVDGLKNPVKRYRGRPRKTSVERYRNSENLSRIEDNDNVKILWGRSSFVPEISKKIQLKLKHSPELKRGSMKKMLADYHKYAIPYLLNPKEGDFAWGQIGNYPFWPCIIINEPNGNNFKKAITGARGSKCLYHVHFFGDNGRRSWIYSKKLIKYSSSYDLQHIYDGLKQEKWFSELHAFYIRPYLKKKWTTAVEEVEYVKTQNFNLQQVIQFMKPVKKINVENLEEVTMEKKRKTGKSRSSIEKEINETENTFTKKKIKLDIKKSPNFQKKRISNESEIIDVDDEYSANERLNRETNPVLEEPEMEEVIIKDDISDTEYKLRLETIEHFGTYSLEEQKALFKRNTLFKGIPKDKVCQFCFNFGELYKCKGGCNGIYHLKCSTEILIKKVPKRGRVFSPSVKMYEPVEIKNEKLESPVTGSQAKVDEDHVQIITVPSIVCDTPPRNIFPPDCMNMTLAERIDFKMKEVMKKFETTSYLQMLNELGSEEKLAKSPSLRSKTFSRCRQNLFSVTEQQLQKSDEGLDRISKSKVSTFVEECTKFTDQLPCSSSQENNTGVSVIDEWIPTNKKTNKNRKIPIKHVTADSPSSLEHKQLIPFSAEKLNGTRTSFMKHITADSECTETVESESLNSSFSSQSKPFDVGNDDLYKNINPKHFKCGFCTENIDPYCFICFDSLSRKGSNIRQKCSLYFCSRFYHPECLKLWPQTQWSFIQTTKNRFSQEEVDSFVCPQHVCHTCASDDPRAATSRCSVDKIVRCLLCPSSYHSTNMCIPAGTEIISTTHIICPKHRKKRRSHTINTTWCFICSQGGNLICCETCPTSVHPECLTVNLTDDDKFICEECESGRQPLYDEIVWVKIGQYKWWPGLILFPNEVPLRVLNAKHSQGEFVVKFFGTYDHYWVNRGRSFLFQEGDTIDTGSRAKNKVETVFKKAVEEAVIAHKMKKQFKAAHAAETIVSLKPPPYIRIKSSKPVGNVKLMELDLSNTTACDCDSSQPNPCGSDTNCLNRILWTECNPEVCPAGKLCQNQLFEKREYPPLIPYKTETRGWGLKALEPIKKGQFVIEYVGELIDDEEYQRRIQKMQEQKEENYYFLTIHTNRMIDAGPKGNVARFMNHCCQPNCETQKWTVNGETRVGLFANEDIPAHTELTFNYNLECTGTEKKICKCGAPNCSGFIGVKAKQENAEPKRSKKSIKKKLPVKSIILPACFICQEKGNVALCNNKICNKAYHLECLKLAEWPEGKKFICPWHYCNICSKRTIRCCVKCLNSFCPTHSEGKVRYDNLIGFVCSSHQSSKKEETNLQSKKKKNTITSEDAIVSSTTDDTEEEEDGVALAVRTKNKKIKKTVIDINCDNVSSICEDPVTESDSQDETVSSATTPDFMENARRKRKRTINKRKNLKSKNAPKDVNTANTNNDSLNSSDIPR